MKLPASITVGGQQVAVPVTLIDRLINWRDPVRGAARWQARARMAIQGGYTAADRSRRANQKGWRRELDPAAAILPDLATLREESQEMIRNTPIGGGAVKLNVTKIVGRGLTVKAQVNREVLGLDDGAADLWERAAEREWQLATDTREIDAERMLPFCQLQALAFLKVLEDGDVLVNLPRFARPGSPYKLKIQLIEAARLCNPEGKADGPALAGGISFDSYGAPELYHVASRHPGGRRHQQPLTWQGLRAFDASGRPLVLHLFDKVRPGQPRGVPYLAPVLEIIKQLGRYTDAEVMAAVVSGMLTAFITSEGGSPAWAPAPNTDNPDGDPAAQSDTTGLELGYGSVLGLAPGQSISTVAPGRPNVAFDPFVMACLRQIGMALELPFEVLVRHFTASYSAARAALEEAWDYFLRRRAWLVSQFCQPVYELVLTEAIASGRLQAPGFFADPLLRRAWLGSLWTGDAQSQLDPVKEIEAAEKRVALRITTRSEERARLIGSDWEDALPHMIKEEALLKAADLLPQAMPAPAAHAAATEEHEEEETDAPD
jgi:lambda family phage portal protein